MDCSAHEIVELSRDVMPFFPPICLPRLQKKVPRVRLPSAEDIRGSKEVLLHEIEKKLKFKDDAPHFAHQQVQVSLRPCSCNRLLLSWLSR